LSGSDEVPVAVPDAARMAPEPVVPAAEPMPVPFGAAAGGRLRATCQSWLDRFIPAGLQGARLDPGWRGVAAITGVVLVAALLAGAVVWRSRPHAVEVSAPPVAGSVVSTGPAASTGPAVRTPGPTVVVAVAGGVRRPGLITLPAGSRVADAVRAAGGLRPGVNIGMLNLARRLVDGEQVVVGAAAQTAPGAPAGAAGPLDLNTATVDQLDALPGVGPVLAARIVAYRTQHGGFRSIDQLREVTGIGAAKFADLRALVTV
jgi:competence protein ComEA